MRPRQAAGTALLATAVVAWPCVAGAQAVDDQPLETAARAAQQVSFEGVVVVRWTDGPTRRVERLEVQGANGSVVLRGDTAVMASAKQRLVAHDGGRWDLLWPAPSDAQARPPTARKYHLVDAPWATVSNRPARVVEARHAGVLVERLFLDQATGLLLRREHFEGGTEPDRTIEFEAVTIGGATPSPPVPARVVDNAPAVVSGPAPTTLADGYVRVGLYRKSGVVQVLFSDGLYDLSVFEQVGRLNRDNLPRGDRLALGRGTGWHYEWAGGHVVIWQRAGTVYTAVSDAPLEHVLGAINSMPPAGGSPSFLSRLRQVCRSLVQPLAD